MFCFRRKKIIGLSWAMQRLRRLQKRQVADDSFRSFSGVLRACARKAILIALVPAQLAADCGQEHSTFALFQPPMPDQSAANVIW